MCGIAGIWNHRTEKPVQREALQGVVDGLIHRGPDDDGLWFGADIGLGFRRLSIIDLAGSHQPMSNEDGSVWLVFNGEIYNFRELRAELLRRGHAFRTTGDSETILHAYEEYGVDCLQRLDGMFAVALWDERRQRLLLARDRLGKKPLVYSQTPDGLAFASEIRALTSLSTVSRDIDPEALSDFLRIQYIPAPKTIFAAVRKLPPAHYLLADRDHVAVKPYWSLSYTPKRQVPEEEATQLVREAVEQAVRERLVSDVPLGAFLSGGIDSSIVVGIMAKTLDRPVETFSIGFQDEEHNELPYAREVAEHFRTNHHEFIVHPDMTDVLPRIAAQFGEPFGDGSAMPTYFLAQQTRQFVTVALSGDGGDEVFAGYHRHQAGLRSLWWDALPRPLTTSGEWIAEHLPARLTELEQVRRFQVVAGGPTLPDRYRAWVLWKSTVDWSQIATGDLLRALQATDSYSSTVRPWFNPSLAPDSLDQMLLADIMTYLPDDLMVKTDINSMAHSLEVRCPLLDWQLVELVAHLPANFKIYDGATKYILRRAFADLLPERIAARPKKGFEMPTARWLRGELNGMLRELLLSPEANRGYFNQEGIARLIKEHDAGVGRHSGLLWGLMMLELWHRQLAPARREGMAA